MPAAASATSLNSTGSSRSCGPITACKARGAREFAPDLNVAGIHHVVRKGTDPAIDSYSGYFDNARRNATGLADYLRGQGVDEVHVMGLAADYCVKFTVLDALDLGFRTTVITDGVRGVEPARRRRPPGPRRNAGRRSRDHSSTRWTTDFSSRC